MSTDIVRQSVVSQQLTKDWLEKILVREQKSHQGFFGQKFDLAAFRAILERYGPETISRWQKLRLESHFLPAITMTRDAKFPGWKVKPKEGYYKHVTAGKILRQEDDSLVPDLLVDKEAFNLEGITVLIDTRLKPPYCKENESLQMFQEDNLLGPIIERLRQEKKIASYWFICQSSRFEISAEEWRNKIKPALAEFLGVKISQVRLERVIEANVIPQLYPYMPRQKDGETDTQVWFEEYLFEDVFYRLYGGASFCGGLADLRCSVAGGSPRKGIAFRPIVILGFDS